MRAESMRTETKRTFPNGGNAVGQFSRSYEVQQLVERIQKMAIGDKITLADLCTLVGMKDVDDDTFRSKLASARRIAQKDKQIVTAVEDRTLERLGDADITATGHTSIQRIRRESVRGAKRLACVNYSALSPAEQRKHDAAATHLTVLAEFSRPKVVAKVAAAVDQRQAKLGLDETLAAFRSEKQ